MILQIEVTIAFLYGYFDRKIYIIQFIIFNYKTICIFLLKNAQYVLKHYLHIWYQTLLDFLKQLNLYKAEADLNLFFLKKYVYCRLCLQSTLFW